MQTLDHARSGRHELLNESAPQTPEPMADAIESLLAADPEKRPSNAAAFVSMLAEVPPPPLARRELGALVRLVEKDDSIPSAPGLASTRPAPTRRPRKRGPSPR